MSPLCEGGLNIKPITVWIETESGWGTSRVSKG